MSIHYGFPTITNIKDVLPHIENDPSFVVVQKGDYTVVNYVMQGQDTFPCVSDIGSAVRRECRGLIFDTISGDVLSRSYHKFFNLGERADLVPDLSKPHVVLEKLDGSMIRPLFLPGQDRARWASKMGITEVSMQAEVYVASRPCYHKMARHFRDVGCTPIFEWCSRQQRIVVDYPEDTLVLTAVRRNSDGFYLPYPALVAVAKHYGVPVVQIHAVDTSDPEWIYDIRALEDQEGVVLRFADGHMVKVKADTYVSLHRAKSLLDNERDVVGIVLDEQVDDLLPLLPDMDKDRLLAFQAAVALDIGWFARCVANVVDILRREGVDRKTFATKVAPGTAPVERSAIFAVWDFAGSHQERVAAVVDWTKSHIRKHLASNKRFEEGPRYILQTARWKEAQA